MEWQANSLQFPFVGNAVGAKDAVRPPKAREALCARRRREKALCARVALVLPEVRERHCVPREVLRGYRVARIWEGYRELVNSTFSRLFRQRANTPAETARFQSTTGIPMTIAGRKSPIVSSRTREIPTPGKTNSNKISMYNIHNQPFVRHRAENAVGKDAAAMYNTPILAYTRIHKRTVNGFACA